MVASSGRQAVDNAREQTTCEPGMCLKNVRQWWGIASMYPDAITAWREADRKHPDDKEPPLGAPIFWEGGQHGHIAIYVGGPELRSTDCTSTGRVSDAHGSWVRNQWGYEYLGWSGDLNGVDLPLDDEDDDMAMSDEHFKNMVRQSVQAELGDENNGVLSDRIADKVWSELLPFHPGKPDEVVQKAGTGWLVYTERRVEALQADLADVKATVDAIASELGVNVKRDG